MEGVLQELGVAKQALDASSQHMGAMEGLLQDSHNQQLAGKGDMYVIHQSTETLHRLVNDLLDLSRLQQGKLPIAPAPMDPRRLIVGIASSHQTFAELPLRFHVSASVPLVVVADELRITQILAK